jgi:hypothetical protein
MKRTTQSWASVIFAQIFDKLDHCYVFIVAFIQRLHFLPWIETLEVFNKLISIVRFIASIVQMIAQTGEHHS